MRRAPRVVIAAIANLLLFHALWDGSGRACVMKSMTGQGGGMPNMPGMQMAETRSDITATAVLEVPSSAPQDRQGPCRFPWAPDGCSSMTPCAPLAIAADEQFIDVVGEAPTGADVRTVLMPPTLVRTPEPPPPKA